jgi:hypothetical protein
MYHLIDSFYLLSVYLFSRVLCYTRLAVDALVLPPLTTINDDDQPAR